MQQIDEGRMKEEFKGNLGVALTGAQIIGMAIPEALCEVFGLLERFTTDDDWIKYLLDKETKEKERKAAARAQKRKKPIIMTKEQCLENFSLAWDQGTDGYREHLKQTSKIELIMARQEG